MKSMPMLPYLHFAIGFEPADDLALEPCPRCGPDYLLPAATDRSYVASCLICGWTVGDGR